jgi:hypothetical protein
MILRFARTGYDLYETDPNIIHHASGEDAIAMSWHKARKIFESPIMNPRHSETWR